MTPDRSRLVALAAALTPARARALVSWLGDDEDGAAGALAASLADAPRRSRLAALAAALAAGAPEPGGHGHPLLERLWLEERAGGRATRAAIPTSAAFPSPTPTPSAGRTLVRPADPSRSLLPPDPP